MRAKDVRMLGLGEKKYAAIPGRFFFKTISQRNKNKIIIEMDKLNIF